MDTDSTIIDGNADAGIGTVGAGEMRVADSGYSKSAPNDSPNDSPSERPLKSPDSLQATLSDEDGLRAHFYGFLSRLLATPMSAETLEMVRALEGGDGALGEALEAFATLARQTTVQAAEEEYSALFYGNGSGGELLPCASWYLTGLVYERPLVDVRKSLGQLGLCRAPCNNEPEDHIAFLCEVMYDLITANGVAMASVAEQETFFAAHLAPWGEKFFIDMARAPSACLYMPLGTIGQEFMRIEVAGFALNQETQDQETQIAQ